MRKRGTALSQGQLAEGVAAVVKAAILAADRIGPERLAFWARNGEALERALIEKLSEEASHAFDPVFWTKFYQKYFGQTPDFTDLRIPPKQEGFNRLIVVARGLTANQIYEACEKHFTCWRYTTDLNGIENERTNVDGPYAIWVRDRREADEENKNLSANDIRAKRMETETLPERLLHELLYFEETGDHLDHENYTLCAGSRYPDGHVPNVYWHPKYRKMYVYLYYPDIRYDELRARSVVS